MPAKKRAAKPNGHVPTVEVTLDRVRHLRFDFNAFRTFEELSGETMLNPEFWAKWSPPQAGHSTRIQAATFAGLRWEDPELTYERVGEMLHMGNGVAVSEAIITAVGLAGGLGGGDPKAPGSSDGPSAASTSG